MPLVIPPLGVTPLGAFDSTRSFQISPPPVIRADAIDPQTQEWTSFLKDQDPIDAQVIEALWRVRRSGAAVQNTGARFLDIQKLDDSASNRIIAEARFALKRLLDNGDITFTKEPTVTTGEDWGELEVFYRNNRTALQRKERQAKIRVPEAVKNGQTR